MLCNSEEQDPRKCINEGKEVTRCGLEFFQKVKNQCAQEFTQYWKCLDKSGDNMHFKRSDIVKPLYVVVSCKKLQYSRIQITYVQVEQLFIFNFCHDHLERKNN